MTDRISNFWQFVLAIVIAAAVICIGIYFRMHDVAIQILGGDELHALHRGSMFSYAEVMSYYGNSDNSVPVTLYAKLLMDTVGLTELRMRAPIMLANLLLLGSPLLFTRRLGRWSALSALALFATSPMMIYYAVVARPYAPAALLTILALFAWDHWICRRSNVAMVAYAGFGAMAIFFHLFCLFPVAALGLLAAWFQRESRVTRRQLWTACAILVGLTLALLGPGLPELLATRGAKMAETELKYQNFLLGYRHLVGILAFPQLLLLILPVLGVASLVRRGGDARRLGLGMALVVLVPLLALVLMRPSGGGGSWGRYYFVVWPVYLLLAAGGMELAIEFLFRKLPVIAGNRRNESVLPLVATGFVLILAASIPIASPMALFRLDPTSFRSSKSMLSRVRSSDETLLGVYQRVADSTRPGEMVILPYDHRNKRWEFLARFQASLGLVVKMASGREKFEESRGVHLANVLDLDNPGELRESGARYLIFDPAVANGKMQQGVMEHFGDPIVAEDGLELYALSMPQKPVPRSPIPRAIPDPSRPNILLLSIDTLRADHLGCYGYERNTSPNLDAFAARSVRFENALAPAPMTLPSHAAMLSGRHPYDLGITQYSSAIPESVPMLAEALVTAGYQTAAIVDSPKGGLLGAERGFGRGFASYDHRAGRRSTGTGRRSDMEATVTEALRWLAEREEEQPFFLFLHTKSVHSAPAPAKSETEAAAPYETPEPFSSQFLAGPSQFLWRTADHAGGVKYLTDVNRKVARGSLDPDQFSREQLDELIALYDAGIRYVDHHFARLIEGLEEMGVADDTIVIVTSDHGEGFLEHGFFLHQEVFLPLLRVPLLVQDPRQSLIGVVEGRVSLMDLAPTIQQFAGLPLSRELAGRPLPLDPVREPEPRSLFAVWDTENYPQYRAYSLDQGSYRLVYHKRAAWPDFRADLFELMSDPDEQLPVSGDVERKRSMLAELKRRIESGKLVPGQRLSLGAVEIEHLRALGYLDSKDTLSQPLRE